MRMCDKYANMWMQKTIYSNQLTKSLPDSHNNHPPGAYTIISTSGTSNLFLSAYMRQEIYFLAFLSMNLTL